MSGPVRLALVGLGWWGQKIATVLGAVPDDVKIVRAVEPDAAIARAFAEKHGVPVTGDLNDALTDDSVEAVMLVTPHALHEEQVAACVANGKHIFCEKPIALTRAGAEKAVRSAEAAGLVLTTGHERRFEPPVAALVEAADKGEMGRLMQIDANFSHDKFLALDPSNWRLGSHAPAAGMTATGIHLVDLAVRLMGPVERVLCRCENLVSKMPQGDTISAFLEFRKGGTATIVANLAMPFISRVSVFGEKAWVDIRDKAHVEAPAGWVVTRASTGSEITVEEVGTAEPVRDNLVAFARAIRGGPAHPIKGEEMIETIAALEAIASSALSGEPVRL